MMSHLLGGRRLLAVGVVTAIALLLMMPGEVATGQGPNKSTPSPKIDSALAEVLERAQSDRVSAQGVRQEASQAGIPIEDNRVRAVVEVRDRRASALISAISRIVGTNIVTAQSQNFLELSIPLDQGPLQAVLRLANLAGVGFIRPPLDPQGLVTSQGVALTGADRLQSQGTRGQGTSVAVIDLGFRGLGQAQSRGELPGNVRTVDFTGSGIESSSSHGTASAEVVHDMAPDAELVLMKIGDEVDLENAVDRAIQMGVDIVNHSVAWFNTSFYDGTGVVNDAVRRARNAGIVWANAAGNYGQRHWQGIARDGTNNGWVEFGSRTEGLRLSAQRGAFIDVYLTWRDWPQTSQDYDLFVVDSRGQIVGSSTRVQNGSQPPTEHLVLNAPATDTYEIRVRAADVSNARELAIFNLNQDLDPFVKAGSIVTPADCSCALAVGAVTAENWTSGPIAPFSSQGPTTDGRPKPDLVGPAGVETTTPQWNPYEGTSAAAPHVAGAASLILSDNPGLQADRLEGRLLDSAIDMGDRNAFGAGRLALTRPRRTEPDLVIDRTNISPSSPRVGETVTISATVANRGNADAGSFTVELSDARGSRTQTVPGLSAGATATVRFSRTVEQRQTDVRLAVDPFNQVAESDETNNSASLSITAQDQPSLSIDVRTDRPRYQVGDPISITVETGADGYVYVYNVDAEGRVDLLFPSSESGNAFLRSGRYDLATQLGTRLSVSGPGGTEHVHAVIASSSLRLGLDGSQSARFTDPNTFRSVLADRIQNQGGFQSVDWAWDVANFQVEARNQPPQAQFTITPSQPTVGEVVTLDGSGSRDPDGRVVRWDWVIEAGRRVETSGSQVRVRFSNAGRFQVTLTVTDDAGATNSTTRTIEVRSSRRQAPTAQFTFSPQTPRVGETVTFDARNSRDPDGRITAFRWDLDGDGRVDATGAQVQTRFNNTGRFTVTLTVEDNDGLTSSASQIVEVSARSQGPTARFRTSPTNPTVDQVVEFDGRASSDPDGRITSFEWDLNGDGRIDATGSTARARYTRPGTFDVTLRVTDNDGRTDSTTQTLEVRQRDDDEDDGDDDGNGDLPSIPSRMGYFLRSTEADRLHITIQGSENWNDDHEFEIRLQRLSTQRRGRFESITANVDGDARVANINEDPGSPTMRGFVQDGRVDFDIRVTNSEILFFTLKLDTDGDGELESGPQNIRIFVLIEDQTFRVNRDVKSTFTINANRRPVVLPFKLGITKVCDSRGLNCRTLE